MIQKAVEIFVQGKISSSSLWHNFSFQLQSSRGRLSDIGIRDYTELFCQQVFFSVHWYITEMKDLDLLLSIYSPKIVMGLKFTETLTQSVKE